MARRSVFWLVPLTALLAGAGCEDAPTSPDTGVVRGRVTRIYSDEPVPGAMVSVAGESTATGGDGAFQIDHAPQGPALLEVRAPEYQLLVRPVEISAYQSLALALTPLDTLVAISGRIAHRVDGPLAVRLDHDHGSVWSDEDGYWELAEVPLGPLAVEVDQPPYNPYRRELLVHSEGQFFEQFMTRDSTVTWWVDNDSYVFMRDDSLNANRGHREFLLVTADLGRTAFFSLAPPSWDHDWAEIVAARLELHGFCVPDSAHPADPQTLSLQLGLLDAPFPEGSIDFYVRPAVRHQRSLAVTIAGTPIDQPFDVDLLREGAPESPGSFWGAALGTTTQQAALVILSNDYGHDDGARLKRPRASYTYRF